MTDDYNAGVRAVAREIADRRELLHSQFETLDIGREDTVYGICAEIAADLLRPEPASEPEQEAHPDDVAVDRFAAAMKAKLAKKRDEGRGGWEVPNKAIQMVLSLMLREHVEKGDPVDVANLAMMLHQRGEPIHPASATGIRRNYSPDVPTNGSGGPLPPPSDD